MRPQRWQPTRLRRPWDSPGKNTGVGCHFLLQWMKVKSESEVAQSFPTLQPHGLQPTRLLRPWEFPGKSTGVGCLNHFSSLFVYISLTYLRLRPSDHDVLQPSLSFSSSHLLEFMKHWVTVDAPTSYKLRRSRNFHLYFLHPYCHTRICIIPEYQLNV